ncbi:MAG: LPXTG cell wall anchor domain-containing protein [Lachnospiraceae bacterium]|nr:LPXTG cell wall anchor domain-containing protein [Lachnospiraceae bacterium]
MRKLVKIILAATLVLSMSATALAAGSKEQAVEVRSAVDKNGNAVTITVEASSQGLSEAQIESATGEDNTSILKIMDLEAPEGTVFPITVTLNVAGVKAGMAIHVLHWNGTAWEEVSATAGDGTVTATFSSLSPVAIVAEKAASTTAAKSPKTGEVNYVMFAAMISIIALASAYSVYRKKKA